MLVFKRLHMKPLKMVTLFTLKVFLGDPPYQTQKISTIFKSKLSKLSFKEIGILLYKLYVPFQNKSTLRLFISTLVMFLFTG